MCPEERQRSSKGVSLVVMTLLVFNNASEEGWNTSATLGPRSLLYPAYVRYMDSAFALDEALG